MTTPYERTRNLVQTGAFLKELAGEEALPDYVQFEARRLLKHFPSYGNVRQLAYMEQALVGSVILTTEFKDYWLFAYKLGAHTG